MGKGSNIFSNEEFTALKGDLIKILRDLEGDHKNGEVISKIDVMILNLDVKKQCGEKYKPHC